MSRLRQHGVAGGPRLSPGVLTMHWRDDDPLAAPERITDFFLGLDLAPVNEFTAFAVVDRATCDLASVLIHGKGNQSRSCPLWASTVSDLLPLIGKRGASERVFLNRRGQPLTRFGIHSLVQRYAARV